MQILSQEAMPRGIKVTESSSFSIEISKRPALYKSWVKRCHMALNGDRVKPCLSRLYKISLERSGILLPGLKRSLSRRITM